MLPHLDSQQPDERIKVEDDSIKSSTTQKTCAVQTLSETMKLLVIMKREFENRHTSTSKATFQKYNNRESDGKIIATYFPLECSATTKKLLTKSLMEEIEPVVEQKHQSDYQRQQRFSPQK